MLLYIVFTIFCCYVTHKITVVYMQKYIDIVEEYLDKKISFLTDYVKGKPIREYKD